MNEKIINEGEPLENDLKHYLENLEELISNPILVLQGSCKEGRHRLTVALRLKCKIRAFCF